MEENTDYSFFLKVVLSELDMQKLKLNKRPASIRDLMERLKESFTIPYDFVVQYEDKDFKSFLSVNDISDIENYGTVKIVRVTNSSIAEDEKESQASSSKPWPKVFPLPEFDFEVQQHLKSNSKDLVPNLKKKIVAALANVVAKYTVYPTHQDIRNMCISLVETYPQLKGDCPGGFDNWIISLKFKMGNLRKTLKDLPEVSVNAGRKSRGQPNAPSSHSDIKKPRRGIVNKDLVIPIGESEASLINLQKSLKEEMCKARPSQKLVSKAFA